MFTTILPAYGQHAVVAHGIVMSLEHTRADAERAARALDALYDDWRANTPSIIVTSVKQAEHQITKVTGGYEIAWHAASLPGTWEPAPGTRFAAVILENEIELWSLSIDGRLGMLEMIYEERRNHPAARLDEVVYAA